MRSAAQDQGFTLIELAVVLFILALLLGGLLAPLAVRREQGERNDTEARLADVREALLGFAVTNGRLPCPDTDADGLEDRSGAPPECSAGNVGFVTGTLPAGTLGVDAFDAWGRRYRYGVQAAFADDRDGADANGEIGSCSGTPRAGVSFELCSNGDGRILPAAGAGTATLANLPAIAISFGANGGTAFADLSADEQENQDANADAVQKSYSATAGAEFDDLLIWIPVNVLVNRMVVAGRLP